MMRLGRPGTTLERLLSRPRSPSDTHCSTLIGFKGMVFGSRPNFSITSVSVKQMQHAEALLILDPRVDLTHSD